MAELSTWFPGRPDGWEATAAKYLFKRERRGVRPEDGVVTAFRDGQVALRAKRRADGFTVALQESGYQGIRKGDLVVHAMDAFAGAIGIAEDDGKATPVYSACTSKSKNVHLPFYAKLLRHLALSGFVESLAKGIRERTTEFRWAGLSEVVLPVPPLATQTAITHFLDHKTSAIDAAIANKRALIADLLKYREAVIAEAVAPREGWRVVRLKHLVSEKICTGVGEAGSRYEPGEPRYLRTSDIQSLFRLRSENVRTLPVEVAAQVPVLRGDILLTTAGSVGKTYFHDEVGDYCYAGFLARIRIGRGHVPRFFAYALSSQAVAAAIEQAKVSSTIDNFSASKCGELWLPVPNTDEQLLITERLDKACLVFDAALEKAEESVAMLNKYRASLISEAVTGKLVVPE
jgi:type I restriction enzyme, S subunit